MKNCTKLILTFFLLFSSQLFSQGLQFELGINDSYKQEILQIANKNEFTYVLVKYDFHLVYIEKYDTLGNRIQKAQLSPSIGFSSFEPNRMVITNDNNIWIAGFGHLACDLPQKFQHVIVLDQNCSTINSFSKDLGFFTSGNNTIYAALSTISDSSVAVNYQNDDSSWVEIFTPTSQSILSNVNTPHLFGFGKNSQFHVLGHTINKIYGIDAQGVLQDSISLPGFFREIGTWNDTIIVLGYNELYKVTPDLQSYTTHSIINLSNFTRLKIDNQGVRFVSSNFNKGIHYLNHNLNGLSLKTVPVFDPSNTIYDFDQSLSVAKSFVLTDYESIRLATYSLTSATNNTINRSDIEVLGLDFTDYFSQVVSVGNVYKLDAKANVLIKNTGPNVVDSVRLNHYVTNLTYCGHIVNSKYFGGLNLVPGDSMWIDFGWLGDYTNVIFNDSIKRTYCVYSSNPNGIVDLNVSNDNTCKTAFFGMLGHKVLSQYSFTIYPNPATNELNVMYSGTGDYSYLISDFNGQTILQSRLLNGKIDISELVSGMYLLSIQDGSGNILVNQKIVKY